MLMKHIPDIGILKVAEFQGNGTSYKSVLRFAPETAIDPMADAVPAEDARLEIVKRKLSKSNGFEQMKSKAELDSLLKERENVNEFFQRVVSSVTDVQRYEYFAAAPLHFTSSKCYRESIRLVRTLCPGMNLIQNPYAVRKLRVLANLCETEMKQKIWSAIAKICTDTTFCTGL